MKIPTKDIWVVWDDNTARVDFDHEEWAEDCKGLAETIAETGQLQPVAVISITHPDYKYKLVFGYRRMFAIRHILEYTEVNAEVLDMSEEEAKLANVIENLDRKDLSYWESCVALKRTFPPDTGHYKIAAAVGKSHGWAYHRWGVWKLPQECIDQVEAGRLTAADVNVLMGKQKAEQVATANAIIEAKQRGMTTTEIGEKLCGRKGVRAKKDVQRMMSKFMEKERMDLVHALRWSIGEINETQLEELL
jgi:ParB/RepB/Spo0J family partition protein